MINNILRFLKTAKGSLLMINNKIRRWHANPCGCDEDFDNRPEIFVDKHAPAGGNGETLETAYNDLNQVINDHPNTKISIKGYGIDDPYIGNKNIKGSLILTDLTCLFLNGIDANVYINGFLRCNHSRFDNIKTASNLMNFGFNQCDNVTMNKCDCSLNHGGFVCRYSTLNACIANNKNGFGFYTLDSTLINCQANNIDNGFGFKGERNDYIDCSSSFNLASSGFHDYTGLGFSEIIDSTFLKCTANNNKNCGFSNIKNSTLKGCTSNNNRRHGVFHCINSTFDECKANDNGFDPDNPNNYGCGFYSNTDALYLDCSASGNHHNPDWICDGTDDSHCDECKEGF